MNTANTLANTSMFADSAYCTRTSVLEIVYEEFCKVWPSIFDGRKAGFMDGGVRSIKEVGNLGVTCWERGGACEVEIFLCLHNMDYALVSLKGHHTTNKTVRRDARRFVTGILSLERKGHRKLLD